MNIYFKGKMSTFGGPEETGMAPDEGLALVDRYDDEQYREYFLSHQPSGTTGLGRRLNPETFYIACRWNYRMTPKSALRKIKVEVRNPSNGLVAEAKPVEIPAVLHSECSRRASRGCPRRMEPVLDIVSSTVCEHIATIRRGSTGRSP